MTKIFLFLLKHFASISLLAALILFAGCKKKANTTAETKSTPVSVFNVAITNVDILLPAFGLIQAKYSVDITPQVSAVVQTISFKEGTILKKGEIMYQLDDRDYRENLVKAKSAAENSVTALRLAEDRFKRNEQLAERKLISTDALESLRNSVEQSRQNVSAAQAAVRQAELQLEFCTVRAPLTGVVGRSLVDPGTLALQGQTKLATIREVNPVRVDFTIAGRDLPRLREAQAKGTVQLAVLHMNEETPEPHAGEVEFVESTIDSSTGTIRVLGTLPNPKLELWPGQFVNVNVKLAQISNAPVIPQSAIEIGVDGPYVFVVQNNKAKTRPVVLGDLAGEHIWVKQGLQANDVVVTEGQINLIDGSPVTVSKPSTSL